MNRPAVAEAVRRVLASIMAGVVVYVAAGWDATLLSVLATVYSLGEAASLQARQAHAPVLAVWANLPVPDERVFDRLAAATVRQSLIVFGFALGYLTGVALDNGHGLLFSMAVASGVAVLLWALVLSTVALLVAAFPAVPLAALTLLAGIGAALSFPTGELLRLAPHLPAGWALRVYASLVMQPLDVLPAAGMCVVLLALGGVNRTLLRTRFRIPEFGWREVPAEQVLEVLVAEEAGELMAAGVPGGEDAEIPEGVRVRAARNLETSLRDVVASGGWRGVPRPIGTVERLIWLLLPADHRQVAQFVAPMGRGVTEGLKRAVGVCLLTVLAAWSGMPVYTQVLGFLAVAFLCAWPGRGGTLPQGLCQGMLPLDPMGLMWIALEIAAMRVTMWLPLLLLQARVLEGAYGMPQAVFVALRVAVLVLALQPFVVALRIGGVDAEVDDYGWRSGTLMGALALPIVVLSIVAMLLILAEPPLTEAPLVAIAGVLSLVVFVLHGLRLANMEPS